MEIIFILLLALAIDLSFGEPPNTWHPVAWLGTFVSLEKKLAPQRSRITQLAYGIGMVLVTLTLIVAPVYLLLVYLKEINTAAYVIAAGVLLKFSFSLRGLRQAVSAVKGSLAQDNLTQARTSLRTLVSRHTAGLNQNQIMSATVESTAENTCDSFVAPLFYFLFLVSPEQ